MVLYRSLTLAQTLQAESMWNPMYRPTYDHPYHVEVSRLNVYDTTWDHVHIGSGCPYSIQLPFRTELAPPATEDPGNSIAADPEYQRVNVFLGWVWEYLPEPTWEFPKIRGPRARIIRTPKKGPPIHRNSHMKNANLCPCSRRRWCASSTRATRASRSYRPQFLSWIGTDMYCQ